MKERTELIEQARKLANLWEIQDGFNCGEIDELGRKVAAYDHAATRVEAATEVPKEVPEDIVEVQKQAVLAARMQCIGIVSDWKRAAKRKSAEALIFRMKTTHLLLPQELPDD